MHAVIKTHPIKTQRFGETNLRKSPWKMKGSLIIMVNPSLVFLPYSSWCHEVVRFTFYSFVKVHMLHFFLWRPKCNKDIEYLKGIITIWSNIILKKVHLSWAHRNHMQKNDLCTKQRYSLIYFIYGSITSQGYFNAVYFFKLNIKNVMP